MFKIILFFNGTDFLYTYLYYIHFINLCYFQDFHFFKFWNFQDYLKNKFYITMGTPAANNVFRNPLFVFLVPRIKIGVIYDFRPAKAECGVYFDLKVAD